MPRYYSLGEGVPAVTQRGSQVWTYPGDPVIVSYAHLVDGDSLDGSGQVDEYMILLPSDRVRVAIKGPTTPPIDVTGPAVVIMPPGESHCEAVGAAGVIRLSPARSRAVIHASDAVPGDSDVRQVRGPSFENLNSDRPRAYALVDPSEDSGPPSGRIFTSAHVMIHWIRPRVGRRDRTKMNPHSHRDYSQASLVLSGSYILHLRTPWNEDATRWRPDFHIRAESPSVTFMPKGIIHSTEWIGEGENRIVDVFSPPRRDIADTEGWVINADDYDDLPA